MILCTLKFEQLCSGANEYRDQRRGQGSGNTEELLVTISVEPTTEYRIPMNYTLGRARRFGF